MKLAFFLLALCTLSLSAGVTINDNGTITKDGAPLNNASDALLNKDVNSAEFMAALQSKLDAANAAVAQAQADVAALQSKMQTQLNGDLLSLQAALKAETDATKQAVLAGQIALVQGYLAAAFKTPAQLQVEQLAAEIAAKQAELAKLNASQQ